MIKGGGQGVMTGKEIYFKYEKQSSRYPSPSASRELVRYPFSFRAWPRLGVEGIRRATRACLGARGDKSLFLQQET